MGTIAEKLTYLNTTKIKLRDSLNKFGSSILSTDTFRSYDTKLNEIYDKLPKITQSGTGFTLLDVQNGQVDDFKMIGTDIEQDTTTGKQLFDINSEMNTNSLIDAGITSTFNEDGTITVNGEKNANYKYIRYSVTLPAGTYYFCGCPSGGSNSSYSSLVQLTQDVSSQIFDTGNGGTFTLTEQTTIQYFPVRVGSASLTFNNTIFRPMISTSPVTYDDFEKYTGGIPSPNPDYPQAIKVVEGRQVITDSGKNLLKPHALKGTINGINVSYDEETRVYTFNGTCTQDNTTFVLSDKSINFIAGVTKSITYWVDGSCSGYCYIRHYDSSYSVYCNYSIVDIGANNDKIEQLSDKTFLNTSAQCSIRFNSGSVANNLQIKVMVTDDENTDYEPYHEPVDYIVDLHGKNLFDKNNVQILNGYIKNDNGIDTQMENWSYLRSYVSVLPNTTYTLSGDLVKIGNNVRIYHYDNDKNWISRSEGAGSGINIVTFTTPNNCYYVQFQMNTNYYNINSIQIEEGSTATNYEEYYDYKLAKIPNTDYKNRIYKSNGNWYYEEKVKKVVLDETVDVRSVNTASSNTTRVGCYDLLLNNLSRPGSNNVVCNYLKGDLIWEEDREGIYTNNADLVFRINKTTIGTTKEEVLNWLSTNNLVVWYPLKSTSVITTQITNTTLIDQLEAISVHTGTNIITLSSDNDMIPEIEITRLKELEKLS